MCWEPRGRGQLSEGRLLKHLLHCSPCLSCPFTEEQPGALRGCVPRPMSQPVLGRAGASPGSRAASPPGLPCPLVVSVLGADSRSSPLLASLSEETKVFP